MRNLERDEESTEVEGVQPEQRLPFVINEVVATAPALSQLENEKCLQGKGNTIATNVGRHRLDIPLNSDPIVIFVNPSLSQDRNKLRDD